MEWEIEEFRNDLLLNLEKKVNFKLFINEFISFTKKKTWKNCKVNRKKLFLLFFCTKLKF